MGLILSIESGTTTCSVALASGLEVVDSLENNDSGYNHAQTLTVYIETILKKNGVNADQLDAIAVSKGPGSYTGLRIGVSAAKGICYATSKPLIAVCSLESMAYGALEWLKMHPGIHYPDYLCPMIDARRLEVYTQLFDTSPKEVNQIEARVLDKNSYGEILSDKKVLFFGNGSIKAKNLFSHKNAQFIDGFLPSARFMIPKAVEYNRKEQYEDLAYFEPFYLKDFVAVKSTKNILGG